MTKIYTLYGIPHSLYTGKVRSYLIKKKVPFNELSCGHESFKRDIVPKANMATIPVVLTPDGQVIRDGAAIIEHFESQGEREFQPISPCQKIISLLFDVIGCEGLLRPAMHYRWNFPDENLEFLTYHFFNAQRIGPARREKTEHMMNKMRFAAKIFGVSDTSQGLVESLYLDFLRKLETHFSGVPYLLGGKPCIGDFGLFAPMYAHLGRDPKPLAIMQREAVNVYRWLERMNSPSQDAPEFFSISNGYVENDLISDSLINVLSILSEDFVPETLAASQSINGWLRDNQPMKGTVTSRYLGQNNSNAEFTVRQKKFLAGAQPYRFYLLQKVHDFYASISDDERLKVDKVLGCCGMLPVMEMGLDRRLGRRDNLEVWL